ncbi:MAG TPA: CaiB/BaiF CoA-transferase family protein, partial [Casimicrobiaceae bacterium]|nr:CaiB/BaiF CoA-transferase family protein [Casimicrobiaceae bacterium]
WGPPYLTDANGRDTSEAAYYLSCNRGKHSVAVDITQPDGQSIVRALARKADVFVENFKVGGLAKYALDYAAIAAVNPRIVYCSITGFGQDGPYADRAGYDFIIQGMAGFMSVTGERDDAPGGGPQKAGVAIVDLVTGLFASTGIVAALAERERTGRGRHFDVALFDAAVSMMSVMNLNYLVTGRAPGRAGNAHQNIVPYQSFACADGYVILAVGNDSQFAKFCEAAGVSYANDPRFSKNADRVRHREMLVPMLDALMRTKRQHEWLALLEPLGVPCGPINTIDQVFADPQVIARGMRLELPHPLANVVPQVSSPFFYDRVNSHSERAPPLLGQQTAKVLGDALGYDETRIADLKRRRIIEVSQDV